MKERKQMRIAFSGASGSGKTTLVRYVAEKYKLPHLNGSSGMMKSEQDKLSLQAMGIDQGKGHAAVIRSGHINPIAGMFNQETIMRSRIQLIKSMPEFVTDRSPIDSIVYYLMQCGPYAQEKDSEAFINEAWDGLRYITHLVHVKPLSFVEDNNSRIPNVYYQRAVDAVFVQTLNQLIGMKERPGDLFICTLGNYRLEQRVKKLDDFLTYPYSS